MLSAVTTVSSIFSKGKCKIWDVWQRVERCRDITSVFIDLGYLPETVNDYQIDILEYFLKELYSPCAQKLSESLSQERPDNDLRRIPMSRPGLLVHVKRPCYQAGYLWIECIENIELPDSTLWSRGENNELVPKWQERETIDILPLASTCTDKSR